MNLLEMQLRNQLQNSVLIIFPFIAYRLHVYVIETLYFSLHKKSPLHKKRGGLGFILLSAVSTRSSVAVQSPSTGFSPRGHLSSHRQRRQRSPGPCSALPHKSHCHSSSAAASESCPALFEKQACLGIPYSP